MAGGGTGSGVSGGDCESASGYFRDFVEQAFGGEVTDDATDFGAVGIENEHRGEGVDAKLLRHSRSFSLSMSIWRLTKRALSTLPTSGWGKTSRASFLQGPHQLV